MTVTLDSPFDDLGIGSLELAELLLRVQESFGVTLTPNTLATAETPRDLLRALTQGSPFVDDIDVVSPPAAGGGRAAPVAASTLIEALDWHVGATPERTHIRILDDTGGFDELTYQTLYREAAGVAAGLSAHNVMPGDTVALMLPTGRAYFVTFAGVMLAGAVPVPVYPPARLSQLADHVQRHIGILVNARAVLLVTVPEAVTLGRALRSNVESLREVLVPEALTNLPVGALPRMRGDNLALVQYTSGSTGSPKGVALTHGNLLSNIRAMGQAVEVTGEDTFVSWLPLYHDMGLIGAWLGSLYFGIPLVAMSPQMFLTRPSRWLRAIHANRGTISAGPNFAYDLCLAKVRDAELDGLDLSCWRLAFNGAKPVSPATIERFASRFGPYGFTREAMTPVYGLAESSVGLAFPPLGRGPLIDGVDRDAFVRSGRANPAKPGEHAALRFVACGRPLPGHEIRIVDATGRELGDRREGRIEFRGPSATAGYFHNADATRSLFHGSWLDTGDLGYVADADLYVTGRVKDVIIRAGRNLHPAELEEAVGDLAGIRKGCVAVFASPDPEGGTERLVVLAEVRAAEGAAVAALRSEIVSTTVDLLGVAPDDVVLVPPHTVPKTSSGKIRRASSREVYEQGRIGVRPRAVAWELARFRLRGAVPSLRRSRRAVSAVAFAAYAWVVYAVLAVSVIVLLLLLPRMAWRRRTASVAVRLLARLTGTRIAVRGRDRLPDSPAVVVANHPSWLDGVVLATVLPDAYRFVGGEVLEHKWVIGFGLKRLGAEFVERHERREGVADTDRVVALVLAGRSVVIFPEGRLDRAPGVRAFHMGAFVVAAQAGVPVIPLAIRGTRAILRPGHRFPRRGSVDITIGHPIQSTGTDWAAAVSLQREARETVMRLSGEPGIG
ncbi:AMP-binding protein [Mycolicibacterium sp. D5.8-2]|uniref:AMP-binding protein n=1 Tax=Mycolicibacterium sp. D5.8-2 TaxID=3085903 RepID=UPI00298C0BE9|nr:AMP-binding protein [Mycolicibacterium sp. D5.8-2]MDW5609722.1 AMP-binding protein [Mycolicibacterium sp. D5.8-2]